MTQVFVCREYSSTILDFQDVWSFILTDLELLRDHDGFISHGIQEICVMIELTDTLIQSASDFCLNE